MGAFRQDAAGSTAVEFAFIGMAFIVLLLGIFQFALAFFAQMYIHDAVSEAATGRTVGTYAGNRSQVVTQICARMFALDNCAINLQLETQPLASYPANAQPITGATFVAGTSGTVMLIRARAPVITFVPGLPTLHVSAAALYTRP
ncbi:pilus assembly protein [Bosea vestrisii]|uniref:TadE family protein n=1 Tax=Bosea vestrisii TaxID=151416 RepID=UPI0024E00958|nr:TadE/TadG family type IV pilus assembly protein [Bosea vestrisii]WID95568.1 pilus assembly protein [Bosea vestrisii]